MGGTIYLRQGGGGTIFSHIYINWCDLHCINGIQKPGNGESSGVPGFYYLRNRLLSDVPGANKQAWWLIFFCKKQEFIVVLW